MGSRNIFFSISPSLCGEPKNKKLCVHKKSSTSQKALNEKRNPFCGNEIARTKKLEQFHNVPLCMRSIFQRFYFFILANALNVASEGVDRSYVRRLMPTLATDVIGFPITVSH